MRSHGPGLAAGALVFALLIAATASLAQTRIARVGLLDYGTSNPSSDARWRALRERMRELGYVEGQNVVFEPRWGQGHADRLPRLAGELIALKVDVLVTATSEAALAAKRATMSIPIVMATSADPVALGLVASLARPDGNVTGVISLNSDLAGKRLELLKQVVPRANRVAILRDPNNRSSEMSVRDAESVASSMGIALHTVDARDPREFDGAFSAMKRIRADAMILGANTPYIAYSRRIADLAVSHRLPMMTPAREYAEAGALVSYGTDYPDQFRRAARYVDKILKGVKPRDLPVEQPTKFELVINLKTAKSLGLTISQSVLERADHIVK